MAKKQKWLARIVIPIIESSLPFLPAEGMNDVGKTKTLVEGEGQC